MLEASGLMVFYENMLALNNISVHIIGREIAGFSHISRPNLCRPIQTTGTTLSHRLTSREEITENPSAVGIIKDDLELSV